MMLQHPVYTRMVYTYSLLYDAYTAWRPHSWKINQPGGRFEITKDLACVERRKCKRKCDCKVFLANRCDPGEVHSALHAAAEYGCV